MTGRPGLERDPRKVLSGPGVKFKGDYPYGALAESLRRAGVAVKLGLTLESKIRSPRIDQARFQNQLGPARHLRATL